MADSSVSVSGPVAIKNDSNARVAYDLMTHISGWEEAPRNDKKTRNYWLKLFWQCYQAASGKGLATVLQERSSDA